MKRHESSMRRRILWRFTLRISFLVAPSLFLAACSSSPDRTRASASIVGIVRFIDKEATVPNLEVRLSTNAASTRKSVIKGKFEIAGLQTTLKYKIEIRDMKSGVVLVTKTDIELEKDENTFVFRVGKTQDESEFMDLTPRPSVPPRPPKEVR